MIVGAVFWWFSDLKFQAEWDPDRPAWTLRLDDIRLRPGSPAAEAGSGSDLQHLPSPPRNS